MIEEITEILNKKPGENVIYHRGLLLYDRGTGRIKARRTAEMDAVEQTAMIAWALYMSGKVHLFQRRLGPHDCEYLAVRTGS